MKTRTIPTFVIFSAAFCFLFGTSSAQAQDFTASATTLNLSGFWIGACSNDLGQPDSYFEASITQKKKKLKGSMDVSEGGCGPAYGLKLSGTIKGNAVSLKSSNKCGRYSIKFRFNGSASDFGDVITGAYAQYVNGDFYAEGVCYLERQ